MAGGREKAEVRGLKSRRKKQRKRRRCSLSTHGRGGQQGVGALEAGSRNEDRCLPSGVLKHGWRHRMMP